MQSFFNDEQFHPVILQVKLFICILISPRDIHIFLELRLKCHLHIYIKNIKQPYYNIQRKIIRLDELTKQKKNNKHYYLKNVNESSEEVRFRI